ncbi:MAG: hypothetical protein EOO24_25835 [Comamonadaceae bacterium]|nr:MAG: hypothetical protein EOO24_25835 [Comamonadaceae bacterium]
MPIVSAVLLLLHLFAAAWWVGGMAVMHFAVRPAAVAVLAPPQRLPFMAATLGRFFAGVSMSVVLLLVSGFGLVGQSGGMRNVHWSVHAMLGLGLVMMAIYGHIRFGVYPKLQRAVAAADWPAAAGRLDLVRRMVAVNLALGVLVFVLAVVGRAF